MPYLTPRIQAALNNMNQAAEDSKLGDKIQGLLVGWYSGALVPGQTVAGTTNEIPVFESIGTVTISSHGGTPLTTPASGAPINTVYGSTSGNTVLLRADFVPAVSLTANGSLYVTLQLKVRRKSTSYTATNVGAAFTTASTALTAFNPVTLYTGAPGLVLFDGDVLTLSITTAASGAAASLGTAGTGAGKIVFDMDVVS